MDARRMSALMSDSALARSSTSFGLGEGRNVTSAGWQVTL